MTQPQLQPASNTAAFFDMDYTVLSGSSGKLYLRYLVEQGEIAWRSLPSILLLIGLYTVGLLDFPHLIAKLIPRASGENEAEVWRTSQAWFDNMLKHYITDKARTRIAWHQSQGHHPVIVSASTIYAVQPVARILGLGDAFLATHLEVIEGFLTGRLNGPACYGQGKVALAQAYAEKHDIDISRSYFYSDSASDLPLLEAVGFPVAVNPERRLRRIAQERGWPIMQFC